MLEWDGVRLFWLHPLGSSDGSSEHSERLGRHAPRRNARACVLRIEAAHGSVLLPSDIEAAQESVLVGRRELPNSALKSDVLVVPHHGSRTSSTEQFIDAVGASTVIFPVGYRNRFGHPRADVVKRYQVRNVELLRTDRDGALTINLRQPGLTVERERLRRRRYWHDG